MALAPTFPPPPQPNVASSSALRDKHIHDWDDTLDRAVSSVALSGNGEILAYGSVNDVRNLLATGLAKSPAWDKMLAGGQQIDVKSRESLERSTRFWDVGKNYKDANRFRRVHLKVQAHIPDKQPSSSSITLPNDLVLASSNETNFKFLIIPNLRHILVVVPYVESQSLQYPSPIEIRQQYGKGSGVISVSVASVLQAHQAAVSIGSLNLTIEFWKHCIARGLAMQMRCDFGIITSVDQLASMAAISLVNKMVSDETSGVVGAGERYSVRANVKHHFKSMVLNSTMVDVFGDAQGLQNIPDVHAEVITLILKDIGEVAMGLPGLSTKCAMVRQRAKGEWSIENILHSANVLKSINQHQEGGVVRRSYFCQCLAISWVIIAITLSVLAGALNVAKRENWYERCFDSVSTASLLLISVFGLVKLTSEDDNAIRNSLLGYRILRNIHDVERQYRRHRRFDVSMNTALAAVDTPLHWLADGNTCYMLHKPLGSIAYTKGIRPSDVRQLGILVGETLTLDFRLDKSWLNSGSVRDGVHKERTLELTDLKAAMAVGKDDFIFGGTDTAK